MRCLNPFNGKHGCGRCGACRINRRRELTARIVLEAGLHGDSCMATLTYEKDRRDLCPADLTLFLKRLRFAMEPALLRYFAVGEYGEKTMRPHYHAALFGVSLLDIDMIDRAWGLGFVHAGDLNAQSAAYIAGYVLKKMTVAGDERLDGRHPEFARMSLGTRKDGKGGLGKGAAVSIAKGLTTAGGASALAKAGDVPGEVRVYGKRLPVGRYIKKHIRNSVGWDDTAPAAVKAELELRRQLEGPESLESRQQRSRNIAAKAAYIRSKQKL